MTLSLPSGTGPRLSLSLLRVSQKATTPGHLAIHTTPPTLLERLRQPFDETAWHRFVHLYTPLLFYWARRGGESETDAADLVQEVLVTLVQTLPTFQYDATGNFRSWLRTLMLNKLRDRKRREGREEKALAQHRLGQAASDGTSAFWNSDYRQELTRRALRLLQGEFTPTTWTACWQTAVEGRAAEEVAQELGITENAVYIAKCRVLRRLRQELRGLVE
jgi:RNA polymerase sigma-70 factor, ECF subfamily